MLCEFRNNDSIINKDEDRRRGGRVVRQRSATPCTAVRIRSVPPIKNIFAVRHVVNPNITLDQYRDLCLK